MDFYSTIFNIQVNNVQKDKKDFVTLKDGRVIFMGGPGAGSGGRESSGAFHSTDYARSIGANVLADAVSKPHNTRWVQLEADNPGEALRSLHETWSKGNTAIRNLLPFKESAERAAIRAEELLDVNNPGAGWQQLLITAQTPAITREFGVIDLED